MLTGYGNDCKYSDDSIHKVHDTNCNDGNRMVIMMTIESLSKQRFCQHGHLPEVNCAVIDGKRWHQPFSFEINNGSQSAFTFVTLDENGSCHHLPSITMWLTSG